MNSVIKTLFSHLSVDELNDTMDNVLSDYTNFNHKYDPLAVINSYGISQTLRM